MRVKSGSMVGFYATLSSKELRSASNFAFYLDFLRYFTFYCIEKNTKNKTHLSCIYLFIYFVFCVYMGFNKYLIFY